jgi:hypothetical protein
MDNDPDSTKLEDLAVRIQKADTAATAKDGETKKSSNNGRVGYDFIGAVLGGGIIGGALDQAFPSLAPWALIGMVVMGFCVGIWLVWKSFSETS